MTRKIILTFIAFCFTVSVWAQPVNTRALFNPAADSADRQEIQTPGKGTDVKLDSLLTIWYIQKALQDTSEMILYDDETVPAAEMPDSVYIRRLYNMPSIIALPYNNIVRNNIVFYMQRIPTRLEMILGLSEYYLPQFEQILDLYNIPLEMRALPIIESALNPVAVSKAGATGMWQFMLATGRQYGLTITSFVDERRDPTASAHAAAKYLNDLYAMYGDWTLVIAAYNCGQGNVNKAIKRANGKRDYWDIYPYLPKETRGYVPAFVAANYALKYYKEHGLKPKLLNMPNYIDTFMVNTNLHFEQISDIAGIPIDELRDLNPQYKKDMIPGVERPYELKIPLEYTNIFIEKESQIYGHKDSVYFNKNIVVTPAEKTGNVSATYTNTSAKNANTKPNEGRQQIIYKVKKGESLNAIAQKNGVKLNDLYYWNNLTSKSTIHPGQKIIIYKGKAKPQPQAQVQAQEKKETAKPKPEVKQKEEQETTTANNKPQFHTVKAGESLWSISQGYDNISYYDLLKINGLNSKSKIVSGQKLKLP